MRRVLALGGLLAAVLGVAGCGGRQLEPAESGKEAVSFFLRAFYSDYVPDIKVRVYDWETGCMLEVSGMTDAADLVKPGGQREIVIEAEEVYRDC